MKSDLPKLMERENIDAIWVSGSGSHNPPMVYFTGGAPLGESNLILIKGKEPVLFCRSMEREVAADTGLKTIVVEKYGLDELLKRTDGDENKAKAMVRKAMLEELGLTKGRIALYGKSELSTQVGIL